MSIDYSSSLIKIQLFLVCFLTFGALTYSFSFDGIRIPPSKSIIIHPYQFFMFEKDESYKNLFVPKVAEYSTIYFNNLKVKSSNGIIQNNESIEIIIAPSKDLESLIKNDQLGVCCNKESLLSGNCQVENTFIKPNIDGIIYVGANLNNSNYSSNIKRGGAYSLMISNCGNSNDGYLYGELVIKNVYGFLPAIEFMKINLYFFGIVLYAFLTIYWIYKCIKNNKQLINMQYFILAELLLSIISSFLWLQYFRQWNLTGSSSIFLFGVSSTINILKLTIVVILTLIASHGVGISIISINSRKKIIAISTTGVMYFLNTLFKEYVIYLRSRNLNINSSLLLYSILPIGILNGIVFFWVFHELVNLLNRLEDDKQTEKLSVYKRFTYILFFSVTIAFIYLMLEVRFYLWDIVERWRYQWIFQDAIPFFFVAILKLNLLLLWVPKENSKKYLVAAEVPIEVTIELETHELKKMSFNNEKDLDCFENTNETQNEDFCFNIENFLSYPDSDYEIKKSEHLNQSNNLVISDNINYVKENRGNLNKYIGEKFEVNKENSMHLINLSTRNS
ncbi:uncharacterized protein cubi_03521 [Cryptosporidium ubiquitum]|uniref:GOST seven transmembrane domain-containing protein n=1 Tax=Cryptosporidium ubiquitum TaxID=857276 RepID=A0A1J4MJU4_9CRYT|nr:uncharacterized protein cubi_03521 [Cryptosporidium ubiquitum]OII73723.1 hypothetical protein cubi_03521 [Cryptosporidium ubiquitum]